MLIIYIQCYLPGRKEEKEESFNLLERVRLVLFVLCYAKISVLYQNYVLPLFFQEQCKLSWSWVEDVLPCFFHKCLSRALVIIRLLSRALRAIRENKVKERWNIFDTKSVLKTSQLRWHERTSVQMQTSYSSLCKTSYGLLFQEDEYTVTISTELNGRTVTQTVEKFPMGQTLPNST